MSSPNTPIARAVSKLLRESPVLRSVGAAAMTCRSLLSQAAHSAFTALLVVWLGSVCNAARRGPGEASSAPAQPVFLLQEPVAYRVYQRDLQGRAQIPLVIVPSQKEASVISAELTGVAPGVCWFADGKFHGVPTGGPYAVNARMKVGGAEQVVSVGPLFVGDLWVLAGQSNMQGYGDLIDVTTPDPRVMSLELDRTWAPAK